MKIPKILCVCEKGNSRSVALGFLLKKRFGLDVISIGIATSSEETKNMLFGWADKIILVDKRYLRFIPEQFKQKLKVYDVGEDKYFRGFDKNLLDKYEEYIKNDT